MFNYLVVASLVEGLNPDNNLFISYDYSYYDIFYIFIYSLDNFYVLIIYLV